MANDALHPDQAQETPVTDDEGQVEQRLDRLEERTVANAAKLAEILMELGQPDVRGELALIDMQLVTACPVDESAAPLVVSLTETVTRRASAGTVQAWWAERSLDDTMCVWAGTAVDPRLVMVLGDPGGSAVDAAEWLRSLANVVEAVDHGD